MTIRKNMRRPVLRRGVAKLGREEVVDLEACFRGESASAWCLLLPKYEHCRDDILAHWAAWKAEHPAARPPAGYEYLDAINPKEKS